MQISPVFLIELSITSKVLSENSLHFLAEGIENNKNLRKLTLSMLSLSYSKGFVSLVSGIQENPTIEYLDLSKNSLTDDTGSFISCIIESTSQLKLLILDENRIKDFSFAQSLSKNRSLLHFSLNFNPLDFVNMVSLLEMLTLNRSLQYLGLKGISFKGPAPIKENPSGLLNMDEAIALKLANVLRYSYIYAIGIDLNQESNLQLREIENSIIKHNRSLMKIDSSLINWNQINGPLLGIYRGLRANQWMSERTTEVPRDLEEIINIKLSHKRTDSLNNSAEDYKAHAGLSPARPLQGSKGLRRKDSWDSKTSDTTVIENKSIKEMSFGKSALNKYFREDETLAKYLQNMNDKIQGIEDNFSTYASKTDLYMEKLESQISNSHRSEEITGISNVLKDIQTRLEKFEQDKSKNEGVIENYIQRLESLRFSKDSLSSSRRSSRRLRPRSEVESERGREIEKEKEKVKDKDKVKKSEKDKERDSIDLDVLQSYEGTQQSIISDGLKGRMTNIEERVQMLEERSLKVNKVSQRLKGTIVSLI